jgi:hypothetical protein
MNDRSSVSPPITRSSATSTRRFNTSRQSMSFPAALHSFADDADACEEPLVPTAYSGSLNKTQAVEQAASVSDHSTDAANIEKGNKTSYPLRMTMLSWAFEILALIASIASIAAIVAILISQNNKPITAWTFIFTLNTIVAALGTVSRTTLAFAMSACVGQQKWSWLRRRSDSVRAFERFDEASRGPWGGSRLFIWLRFR